MELNRDHPLVLLISAALIMLASLLIGCTVAGSACSSSENCPTGWTCSSGRCTPPPPPPKEPHDHLRDLGCPSGQCDGRAGR